MGMALLWTPSLKSYSKYTTVAGGGKVGKRGGAMTKGFSPMAQNKLLRQNRVLKQRESWRIGFKYKESGHRDEKTQVRAGILFSSNSYLKI